MTKFMWTMGGALVVAFIGLGLLFWSLERTALVALDDGGNAETARAPFDVYVSMFIGLVLLGFAVFFAVLRWSQYLGENPESTQIPAWLGISIIVVALAALVAGIAIHSAWLNEQDPVPTLVNDGFVLFEVMMGAFVLVPLVLVGVRWAPGFRREPDHA